MNPAFTPCCWLDNINIGKKIKAIKSNRNGRAPIQVRSRLWHWLGLLALGLVIGWGFWSWRQSPRTSSPFTLSLNSEMPVPDEQFFARAASRAQVDPGNRARTRAGSNGQQPTGLGFPGVPANPSEKQIALAKEEQVVNDINEGVRLLKEGDIPSAIQRFNRVLEVEPRSEDAHFNLGIAYGRLGNTATAVDHYKKAIEIMPKYAEAYNNLGNLLTSQERYEEAISNFTAAISILPNYASAHNNYGTALVRVGKFQEAAARFQEAIRLLPDYAEAHFNLANTWLRLNQTGKAIQEYKETLRLRPGFEPAIRALSGVQRGEEETSGRTPP